MPLNESLIVKLEALKFPNARLGSHMESGNSMVDACIAVLRLHQAEQPSCTCTREYQCFSCAASGSPSEMRYNGRLDLNPDWLSKACDAVREKDVSTLEYAAAIAIREYLRWSTPEPVSLKDMHAAIAKVSDERGHYDERTGIIAVLDAAGVKYAD